jgi:K(+)-stimulated pyrophosphate-energized sodium pump
MEIFDAMLFPLGVGIVAILVAVFIIRWILRNDSGSDRMKEVSGYIVTGTSAYLKRQIKTIFLVMPWLAALISYFFGWTTSVTFICGALLSLLAGYIGMNVAVRANTRAASAARKSSAATFRISFLGGTVTGLLVTGISMLGLYILRLALNDLQALVGFGFGASLAPCSRRLEAAYTRSQQTSVAQNTEPDFLFSPNFFRLN